MEANKATIIDRIKEMYEKTGGWTFYNLVELTKDYKGDWRKELNDLRLQGIVRKGTGSRGTLVEYLPKEKSNTD